MAERERKLVVLGIPWDVDTEGLEEHMSKYGDIDDIIVMRDRKTNRSRGFGYVTFSSVEDAKKVLEMDHVLNGRKLEVKVATPKEEMKTPSKKITRIFVARIPSSVTEDEFRSYFESYGNIEDLYMPKEQGSKGHRGIGFITFENSETVDKLMSETHKLGGATIAIDRAAPKEESSKHWGGNSMSGASSMSGGYGAYNAYINAATRYAHMAPSALYDHASPGYRDGYGSRMGTGYGYGPLHAPGGLMGSPYGVPDRYSGYGHGGYSGPSHGMGKKIFVGRLPQEANAEDLRRYFSSFGTVVDVYVPKDPKKKGHRGFGFVTFGENGIADRVARRAHEILGQQVAIDSATPLDDDKYGDGHSSPVGAAGHPRGPHSYLGDGGYDWEPRPAGPSARLPRMDYRYRPY